MSAEPRPVVPVQEPHPLADEIAAPDYSGRLDKLARRAAGIEPLRDYTHEPGWADFDQLLADEEHDAIENLLDVRTMEAFLAYRARVKVIRWMRGIPSALDDKLQEIQNEMEDLEQEEEEDAT